MSQTFYSPDAGKAPNQVNKWNMINLQLEDVLHPGAMVRVTQQAPRTLGACSSTVEGEVVSHARQKTGSWYAHSKDDRLWLDRLTIRKADGEVYVCNVEPMTRIEVLEKAVD